MALGPAFRPLAFRLFRILWIAQLASNLGTWMHSVGAVWLMTSLSRSPLLVALLSTAESLPLFLLALPAGALGDAVDRRRYLVATQIATALAQGALGAVTLLGLASPPLLLGLTLAMGVALAMNAPVGQAVMAELVPAPELGSAIALNSVSYNAARAAGPAIGGLIVAATNPGLVFLLNAATTVVVAVVLYRWHRQAPPRAQPAEPFLTAIRVGLGFARSSSEFRIVLARAGSFIVFGSAFWAFLPIVGRQMLGLDSIGYGLALGAFGTGAVTIAMIVLSLKVRPSVDHLVTGGGAAFGAASIFLAFESTRAAAYATMFFGGAAWIATTTSLNVATQRLSPPWVGARATAVYTLVFQAGQTVGSLVWGILATRWGLGPVFAFAGFGMMASVVVTSRLRVVAPGEVHESHALHWPRALLHAHPLAPVLLKSE